MPTKEFDPTKHSADRIVSNEDKLDPHFEKIKLGELTLTDLDLYLQIKKIRTYLKNNFEVILRIF